MDVVRNSNRQRGQSTIEFALLLPLLIGILVASVDFGRMIHATIAVNNSARVGAQYGATNGAGDIAGIRATVLAELTGLSDVTGTNPAIAVTTSPDNEGMTLINVAVNYIFTPITRIPNFPGSQGIVASSAMRVKP